VKLLSKYNRVNFITAIIILLSTSVTYYFIIRSVLLQQIDTDLKVEEQEIYDYIKEKNALPDATNYKDQEVIFEKKQYLNFEKKIVSGAVHNAAENENEPVRILTFPIVLNNVVYKATVIKSQVESEDLLKVIVMVTAAIFFLLLIVTLLINRFLLGKLWQPFYETLEQLRVFNITNPKPLMLTETTIAEFRQLNSSVLEMTKHVNHEFESLKSFTDNASHEMQTPLAIINSKLDVLLQTATEKQSAQLQAIYNATGRLTKLTQTLLLLSKINNDQYSRQTKVDLTRLLDNKLKQFEELIKARNIHLKYEREQVFININEELIEILLNNLISNTIKHNYNEGYIYCKLTSQKLLICNSGFALSFEKNNVFNRFQKGNSSDGTGLGLAVAQEICENSGLHISYNTDKLEHTITVSFN
jgi:signal transduction histidine kinase